MSSLFSFRHKGNFSKVEKLFKDILNQSYRPMLDKYAQEGVRALAAATPKDSGVTASSWYYEIVRESGCITIRFNNSNVESGVNIAVILQYGHGTNNGGYVVGRNYINPSIRPIFDKIAEEAWKEVTKS